MRDKLIHEYFGVDLTTVWDTIQEDLSPLKEAVENLLHDLKGTASDYHTNLNWNRPCQRYHGSYFDL